MTALSDELPEKVRSKLRSFFDEASINALQGPDQFVDWLSHGSPGLLEVGDEKVKDSRSLNLSLFLQNVKSLAGSQKRWIDVALEMAFKPDSRVRPWLCNAFHHSCSQRLGVVACSCLWLF